MQNFLKCFYVNFFRTLHRIVFGAKSNFGEVGIVKRTAFLQFEKVEYFYVKINCPRYRN